MGLLLLMRSQSVALPRLSGAAAIWDMSQLINGGQTVTDQSGNGYHATMGSTPGIDSNDPAWFSSYVQGDGVDDYVALPNTGLGTGAMTLVDVVMPTTTTTGIKIVHGYGSPFHGTDGTTFVAREHFDGTQKLFASSVSVVAGQPYLMVSVRANGRFDLYIGTGNVLTKTSLSTPGSITRSPTTGRLLANNTGTSPSPAKLYHSQEYIGAPSDAEIDSLYQAMRAYHADAAHGGLVTL